MADIFKRFHAFTGEFIRAFEKVQQELIAEAAAEGDLVGMTARAVMLLATAALAFAVIRAGMAPRTHVVLRVGPLQLLGDHGRLELALVPGGDVLAMRTRGASGALASRRHCHSSSQRAMSAATCVLDCRKLSASRAMIVTLTPPEP